MGDVNYYPSIVIDFIPLTMHFGMIGYYYPVYNYYSLAEIIQDAATLPYGSVAYQDSFDAYIATKSYECMEKAEYDGTLDSWVENDYPVEYIIQEIVNSVVIHIERHVDQQNWGKYVFTRWIDPQQTLMMLIHHDIKDNNHATYQNEIPDILNNLHGGALG